MWKWENLVSIWCIRSNYLYHECLRQKYFIYTKMDHKDLHFSIHYNGGSYFLLTLPSIPWSALNFHGFNERGQAFSHAIYRPCDMTWHRHSTPQTWSANKHRDNTPCRDLRVKRELLQFCSIVDWCTRDVSMMWLSFGIPQAYTSDLKKTAARLIAKAHFITMPPRILPYTP
jgi:hypothetical protein